MSVFVAPDQHIGRLLEANATKRLYSDIVTQREAIQRMLMIKGVREIIGTTLEERIRQCKMAIEFFKCCNLCFELSYEQAIVANGGQPGLMFPSLRVASDLISVPFGRHQKPDPEDKIVASRLRSLCRDISISSFSRALVGLHAMLDVTYQIFCNCAMLLYYDTQILIAFQQSTAAAAAPSQAAPSASANVGMENEIIVVAFGKHARNWREGLGVLLNMCDITEPLCPICV
jgi:hypothetical protein